MSKLNISILEPVGGHGGMEYYDYGLCEGLANSGEAEVHFFTCNKTEVREHPGVTTVKSFGDVWNRSGFGKLRAFLGGYRKAFKQSQENSAAIVHFHFFQVSWLNLWVLLMARKYRFNKVLTLHDVDPLANKSFSFVHKWTYKLVDKVIVHNAFSKDELSKKPIEKRKVEVIPHGNYLPFITPKPQQKSDRLELLFFGQIKEVKGLNILLEAMQKVTQEEPTIHLTIAGRPWKTDKSSYEQKIQDLGLESSVTTNFSYIPNEEVSEYFAKADVVVLPYKRIYQSGVLLLSMSYGVPCLASDLPPFEEIIQEGHNGFTFASESVDSLSEKILEIARKKDELPTIAANSRQLLDTTYDWNNIGKRVFELYTSMIT